MFMSFEKIEPDDRHPALKAAEMIRQMHVETIALIDGGQVFMKDGVDVSTDMRAQCVEQLAAADKVIEYAKTASKEAWKPQGFLLEHAEEAVIEHKQALDAIKDAATIPDAEDELPEIGNYDQTP